MEVVMMRFGLSNRREKVWLNRAHQMKLYIRPQLVDVVYINEYAQGQSQITTFCHYFFFYIQIYLEKLYTRNTV